MKIKMMTSTFSILIKKSHNFFHRNIYVKGHSDEALQMNGMLQEITIHVYVKILTQTKQWGRKRNSETPQKKKKKKAKTDPAS
jgi:hypothetical protein